MSSGAPEPQPSLPLLLHALCQSALRALLKDSCELDFARLRRVKMTLVVPSQILQKLPDPLRAGHNWHSPCISDPQIRS